MLRTLQQLVNFFDLMYYPFEHYIFLRACVRALLCRFATPTNRRLQWLRTDACGE